MRRVLVLIPVVSLLLFGCHRGPPGPTPKNRQEGEKPDVEISKVLKVKVMASGEITADEKSVTLEQLASKLTELKQAGGVVWYHRENPGGEPHANAMKVMELVVENKLPIRLSAKSDFSDVVDDKGVSRPGRE
jgi:biopolymer transport protein ExbD